MWCSSLNKNFFDRYCQFKRNSIFFNKTIEAIDLVRRSKPGYFNRQILYRKIPIVDDGWITPFYLLLQFAPVSMIHYILRHRDPCRPIASDKPSVMHALCSKPFCFYNERQILNRIDYVISRFVGLELFENDAFGRPCFFYVRKAAILDRLVALGASTTGNRSCAEFAIETDNAILFGASVQPRGEDTLHYLQKAVAACKPNVIDFLMNRDAAVVPRSLRREAYVSLAMHYRFDPFLFESFWALAQAALLPSTADGEAMNDFCDNFYSMRYGPDSPQRFNYHLNMFKRRSIELRHADTCLELMLRYPKTFRTCHSLDILPAERMDFRYTERLVEAYPRFLAFSDKLRFLFHWMNRLKNCAFAEEYAALLSRAVAFRGDRGRTFLHYAPNPEFLRRCLNAGAEVDALDDFGNTPLAVYSKQGRWNCAKKLVASGAHRDVKNVNYKQLKQILDDFDFDDVFPLQCLAARVVNKHCSKKQKNAVPIQLKNFIKCH